MNTAEHSDPGPPELPQHLRITMAADVERLKGRDATTVLLGGSPLRLLRLRPAAVTELDRLLGGAGIGPRAGVQRLVRRLLDAGVVDPVWPVGSPTGCSVADVTMVIPARDRSAMLSALLASVASLPGDDRPDHVIVVDDGSTDDTAATAHRFGATVIAIADPLGPGGARNAGLAAVGTLLVAFVDSDCQLRPGWLGPLLAHLDDSAVALVAPRIVGPDAARGASRPAVERYEAACSALDRGPRGGYVRPMTRIPFVPAAALVGRVAPLKAAGGFATDLRVGEDVDLVWRLHAAGARVRYEPSATVAHTHRSRLGDMLRRRAQYGTSAAVLTERHPGKVTPLAVSGWSLTAWLLVGLGGLPGVVAGIGVATGTSALLPRKLDMLADPRPVAWRLAMRGHLGAGRLIASAVWRAWLPLALLAAVGSRRARVAVAAAAVLPAMAEWRGASDRPTEIDPVRFIALRMAEDTAYCAGVWLGCVRRRSAAALVPDLRNWPGRRRAREDVRS